MFTDGFRKVIGAEQGGLRSEKDEWEFFNGNFNKYHPELLENVKRKVCALFKIGECCLIFSSWSKLILRSLISIPSLQIRKKLRSSDLICKRKLANVMILLGREDL